jgi:hypothetical protein
VIASLLLTLAPTERGPATVSLALSFLVAAEADEPCAVRLGDTGANSPSCPDREPVSDECGAAVCGPRQLATAPPGTLGAGIHVQRPPLSCVRCGPTWGAKAEDRFDPPG